MPVPLCQCRLGPCQYNLTCRRIVPKKEVAGWRVPHFFVVVASDKGTMLSTGHRLLLKNPEITTVFRTIILSTILIFIRIHHVI